MIAAVTGQIATAAVGAGRHEFQLSAGTRFDDTGIEIHQLAVIGDVALRGTDAMRVMADIAWRALVGNCLLYTSPSPRD